MAPRSAAPLTDEVVAADGGLSSASGSDRSGSPAGSPRRAGPGGNRREIASLDPRPRIALTTNGVGLERLAAVRGAGL